MRFENLEINNLPYPKVFELAQIIYFYPRPLEMGAKLTTNIKTSNV